MDVKAPASSLQEGGTRRRRRARRSKTQRGGAEGEQVGGASEVMVQKADALAPAPVIVGAPASAIPPASAPVATATGPVSVPKQAGGAKASVAKQLAHAKPATAPVVVLAPAKKKAKVMLISKKEAAATGAAKPTVPQKTFKAKRVRVTIDNTARTQKRRRQVLRSVDSLTEEQLREQAVKFGLSRADTVKKVPVDLLRKMLKDYYAMRKGFL
jgi:hypothetical protein